MATPDVVVRADDLRRFIGAIFRGAGFPDDHARIEADVLVWANLRGVDSHGVFRVPRYVGAIRSGAINPTPDIRVERRAPPVAVIEADRAAGPVAMTFAMGEAVATARDSAIGWALVRDTTHTGPMGYYARIACGHDMIGIVMSASKPIMAYHGTRVPTVSTNPLAIAVPCADAAPIVLDMATAAIAWGKLSQARRAGGELPGDVALDRAGRVTTDASEAALPLPLAGAKGAGLSLMIECLTSLLAGAPLIAPALGHGADAGAIWQHGTAIAVNIAAFGDPARFAADAAALADAVRAQPRAEGFDEVLMPGERGEREAARRERDGIPVAAGEWRELVQIASGLGIAPPATLAGMAG